VLDADIAACFDRIDQTALLRKLHTFPTLRRAIRGWLKAGGLDGQELLKSWSAALAAGWFTAVASQVACGQPSCSPWG
jgi:RNA-directed DNA polymerase